MTKAMIVATVLLGMANVANAADATWRASVLLSKDGGSACGADMTFAYAEYTIAINGVHLVATPDAAYKANWPTRRGNVTNLKADGSGTLTWMNAKGQPWDFVFDPGQGARKIKYGARFGMCRFEMIPMEK